MQQQITDLPQDERTKLLSTAATIVAMRQVFTEELRDLMVKNMELKRKLASSHTKIARKLYSRRIKENSEKGARLLMALENLNTDERSNNTDNNTETA